MNFLFVGIGGFFGSILRIWVGETLSVYSFNTIVSYHTLIVNLLGSYLLAFFLVYVNLSDSLIPANFKKGISIGFLGSFTTFSTFSIETVLLFQNGEIKLALFYVLVSFIGGFIFAWLGLKSGFYFINIRKKILLGKR